MLGEVESTEVVKNEKIECTPMKVLYFILAWYLHDFL